jgi:hypothetical protein
LFLFSLHGHMWLAVIAGSVYVLATVRLFAPIGGGRD